MPISSRQVPMFPLEILEQIIDLHGGREEEQTGPTYQPTSFRTRPSKTLLACHLVSRQFRACALRHTCRSVSIALYDTSDRLQDTQNTIFDKPGSVVGSLVPLIKEFNISLFSLPDYDPPLPRVMHQDSLVRVLEAFAECTAIRKLSLVANLGTAQPSSDLDWMRLPSDIQQVLKSLLRLPSISSLCFRDIVNIPAPLLEMANARLHTLEVIRCLSLDGVSPSSDGMPLDLGHSNTVPLYQVPLGFTTYGFQIVQFVGGVVSKYNTSWGVIGAASSTLKNLAIHDTEEMCDLPPEYCKKLKLASFPQLETFSYSYNSSSYDTMFSTLHDVVRFFDVSQVIPNLRLIEFNLFYLGDNVDYIEQHLVRMIENDSPWKTLDQSLANKCYSGLRKVFIHVECTVHDSSLDDFRAAIIGSFPGLKSLSISVEVDVVSTSFKCLPPYLEFDLS